MDNEEVRENIKESSVSKALDRLKDSIILANEKYDLLNSRLESVKVARSESPRPEGGTLVNGEECKIAEGIYQNINRIHGLREQIEKTLRELEI